MSAARIVKPGLLLAFLACDYRAVAERVEGLGLSVGLVAFVGLYILLALGLAACGYIARASLRVSLAAVLAAAAIFLLGYEWATASPLDYTAFETMVASRGDAGDAWRQNTTAILKAAVAGLLLFAALAWPPRGERLRLRYAMGLPSLALAVVAAIVFARGGQGSSALPAPFVPLAHAAIMQGLSFTEAGGERRPVSIQPVSTSATGDVVLIVDESIAARYLDINDPRGVRSGLASPPAGVAVHNYGIAVSATNCSAGSNRTLRFGGSRDNYWLASRTYPSIWAYAHRAGYRTVYMDAQRTGGDMQNLASDQERAEIDDFVQFERTPVLQRDVALAGLIAARLGNGVREFVYVNKIGAHFPVADKFPDSFARFAPMPVRGKGAAISDIAAASDKTAGEWWLYRNAYRNTLEWNVGEFFDRLLPAVARDGGVLLYTSDHGQDLHERGDAGGATHCVTEPRPEEGAVPLVVIDRTAAPGLDWAGTLAANRDGMSHFRIFPTLLELMGYRAPEIAPVHGPPLTSARRDAMTFTPSYFVTLGREPAWREVVPARLARPPLGDYTRR